MANALDYVRWRGDLSFDASPVNEVDIFLFSQLSTPDYSGIVPPDCGQITLSEACGRYFAAHEDSSPSLGVLQSEYVIPMLRLLPEYGRFAGVKLSRYVNRVITENVEQFSAVTIDLPNGAKCISFRGTDDTIIGWKEDCNLAVSESVPAQKDALAYLISAAEGFRGELTVCGHSKGGNLAIYAAANAPEEIRKQLRAVYNYDGPGFNAEFLASEGYLAVKDRITTVLSQNSLVGILLTQVGTCRTVRSCKSGPIAHDGFTWEVLGREFVPAEGLSDSSRAIRKAMNETLAGMDCGEKQGFIDELFGILLSTGSETITELSKDIQASRLQSIAEAVRSLHASKKVTSFMLKVAASVLGSAYEDNTARIFAAFEEATARLSSTVEENTAKITAAGAELMSSVRSGIDSKIDSAKEELLLRYEKSHRSGK